MTDAYGYNLETCFSFTKFLESSISLRKNPISVSLFLCHVQFADSNNYNESQLHVNLVYSRVHVDVSMETL